VSALIAGAEARSPEAGLGERISENQRRVFQIAYSVLGNAADAEDVAQEAFLRACQKSALLRDTEKFRGWVNRIVFRLALNRKRGHRRRLARDTAWQMNETRAMVDGVKDAEQQVLVERLRREIERLPKKLRSVLRLSLVEEMEAADVGAVLGIPAGTVRSRLHTARKLLLDVMK
jgi:RNA polymerase sigma-70 factor (ECF subfamily)